MTAKILKDVMQRAETWPEEAQDALAEIALEIDGGLGGVYSVSEGEREGIERGLTAMREGRFASDERVAAILRKARSPRT
jgi:hypothetical protein